MNNAKLEQLKVRTDLENRRILISASLVSVLLVVSLFNETLFSQKETPEAHQVRAVANVTRFMNIEKADSIWEKKLALALSRKDDRDPASLGQSASPMEQLRFGLLEGKYAFQMEQGKIKAIEYVDTDATNDRPKYINDKPAFLDNYRDLFKINFSKVIKKGEESEGLLSKETYQLYNAGRVVGEAQFVSDQFGRIRVVRVDSLN